MRILLKFTNSLNFKRVGKGTVFTEFSVVTREATSKTAREDMSYMSSFTNYKIWLT